MIELQEIFEIQYGNSLDLNKLSQSKLGINFVSRTAKKNGVSARVNAVLSDSTMPRDSITVSLGGSVLEAFVQPSEYYTGYHIFCLTPKEGTQLTISQKLFYCACIRANKYKYSYGRQANRTLKYLKVPSLDELPSWINEVDLSHFDGAEKSKIQKTISAPIIDDTRILKDLFEIKNGIAATGLNIKENRFSDCIAYIRPASTSVRVIRGFLERSVMDEKHIYPKGSLFVSTNGEGSHSYSYVSIEDFVPNSDVSVLIPKDDMSLELKLYYAKCIVANRYLFSYGRKPKGKRLSGLLLPKPTLVETKEIEDFIKSLNYSINL
jgi:hypothetical protein